MSVDHEAERLKALASLGLLDMEFEAEFDQLVELAAAISGTPICAVSLMDDRTQWIKSSVGLEVTQVPREITFCTHAIDHDGIMVIEDALTDRRFSENVLVTGEPYVRFYAGVPLTTQEGVPFGTLCVADHTPRQLTNHQKTALQVLARQVTTSLMLRVKQRALDAAIAEKDAIAEGLRASEELFRTFMNSSPVASFIKDLDGRYVFYNTKYAEAFGLAEPALGRKESEVRTLGGNLRTLDRTMERADLTPDEIVERVEEVRGQDGQITHWRSFRFPCRDANGRSLIGCVAIDTTSEMDRSLEIARYQAELEEANDRLRNLAVTDELTGLRNRRAFEERLTFEFSMARRKGRELSVVLLDADDFKKVNDRLGHPAGDSVLQQLANVLQNTVRLTDLAVRYGGEEFAVILSESDERSALLWARRFQQALETTAWEHLPITVSMGIAGLTSACVDMGDLVARADEALYRAKRHGKNRAIGASDASEELAG